VQRATGLLCSGLDDALRLLLVRRGYQAPDRENTASLLAQAMTATVGNGFAAVQH
jgi:hypothetical protein